MKNKWIAIGGAVVVGLAVVSLIVGLASSLGVGESFRIVFGSVYVLFVPGFIFTFVFFPLRKGGVDWMERIALSFALSIAIVPLAVFYLNLAGLRISAMNSFLTVLVVSLVGAGLAYWRSRKRGN